MYSLNDSFWLPAYFDCTPQGFLFDYDCHSFIHSFTKEILIEQLPRVMWTIQMGRVVLT